MKLSSLILALATSPATPFAAESLDTLVVTATGYPTNLDDVPASMEVITAEEIQRSAATDITDLLKFHTGLEIGRNGGPGQATSLFMRGTESDHNLIMIDGIPINSGSVGSAALQHIDPQNIERIEIYKGPRSTLWGSGAIGGVINIVTRKADVGLRYGASLEGGSDNTWRTNAYLGHSADGLNLSANLSYQKTDGFPPLATTDTDRGYENTSFDLAAGLETGIHRFSASHWQTQGNNEYLDYFGNSLDQDFLNSRSSLSWESAFNNLWTSTLLLAHVRDHIDQNQSSELVHTDRTELSWQNNLNIGIRDQLQLGIKASNEDVIARGGFSPYDTDTDILETWGQYDLRRDKHHAIAGIRYLDHEDAGSHVTWSLNYGYDFAPGTHAWASAATAFRVPSTNERFGFGGNPDLESEESTSYELGLKHRMADTHELSASLYRNDIDNMIQWVLVTPPFTGFNQNIAEVRIDGLELGYDYSGESLSLHLGGNWQNSEDRKSGERLLRRTEQSLNARIQYAWGAWHLGGDLLWSGNRKDFGDVTLNSYTLVNLNASYELDKHWQLFAKLENAFDEEYQLATGYNTQDRATFLGIRYNH